MHQSSPLPWLVAVPTCPHGCTQPMVPPACPLHCPSLPRQTGVGLCSMSARLAGIIAPLVLLLDRYHPAIPMAIFGSVTVVVGLFCFLLPETRGTDLADDMGLEDIKGATPQKRWALGALTVRQKKSICAHLRQRKYVRNQDGSYIISSSLLLVFSNRSPETLSKTGTTEAGVDLEKVNYEFSESKR